MAFTAAPTSPYPSVNAGVMPEEIDAVPYLQFIQRNPLYTRLPRFGNSGSPSFLMANDNFRPRTTTLNNGGTLNNSATTMTMTDGSFFIAGDKFIIDTETFEVQSTNTSTNVVTVGTRGSYGNSAASHTDGSTVYLIGNTRTGAEINQTGITSVPATTEQYIQHIQIPYSTGGGIQTFSNYVSPFGGPFRRDVIMATQALIDGAEGSALYGTGLKQSADTTRPLMLGLRSIIVTNRVTSPTNAGAYKLTDFVRDTVLAITNGGGECDLIVVHPYFAAAFLEWGLKSVVLSQDTNILGITATRLAVPFLDRPVEVWQSPALRPWTAVALTSREVGWRVNQVLTNKPKGSRGDADEGDLIWRGAIECVNESHHAWVEGVTAVSAT